MITFPLLSNVRHKAIITPVRPPLARLIHISPSCWTIYRLFEIILEMVTVHWIELQIQCSIQVHCFKKHSVRYELCFKKYLTADMERKYMNSDKVQTKEPELTTCLSGTVGGGTNIQSKQTCVLRS